MTRKADTLRPFLRCAAVVLCSLALPLVVFALWDRTLLAAPHTRTDGERFTAAGRANTTACTLYAAEHVTKVPARQQQRVGRRLDGGHDGWQCAGPRPPDAGHPA